MTHKMLAPGCSRAYFGRALGQVADVLDIPEGYALRVAADV